MLYRHSNNERDKRINVELLYSEFRQVTRIVYGLLIKSGSRIKNHLVTCTRYLCVVSEATVDVTTTETTTTTTTTRDKVAGTQRRRRQQRRQTVETGVKVTKKQRQQKTPAATRLTDKSVSCCAK